MIVELLTLLYMYAMYVIGHIPPRGAKILALSLESPDTEGVAISHNLEKIACTYNYPQVLASIRIHVPIV